MVEQVYACCRCAITTCVHIAVDIEAELFGILLLSLHSALYYYERDGSCFLAVRCVPCKPGVAPLVLWLKVAPLFAV